MAEESKDIYEDYHFVKAGKKRVEILKLLSDHRTPTELKKLSNTPAKTVSETLKSFQERGLVECHELPKKGQKTYKFTKRGELAGKILDIIEVEPKTILDLTNQLGVHRNEVVSVIKELEKDGFIVVLKTAKPARKVCHLTEKGEELKEKLE